MSRFYVTTAIDYVNAKPHLGHAYEKLAADALARYHRLRGDDTRFLTGLDEHSQNVEKAARRDGLTPLAYTDRIAEDFRAAWRALDISHDDFIRTTEPRHKAAVAAMIERIREAGDIYQSEYEGWYCNGCEAFKIAAELVDGLCPEHKTLEPVWLKEKNWFFRLSRFQDFLLEHYRKHPEFILPEERRNELLEVIRGGLRDLSISRESATWGIPVPFDPGSVIYVWFDALINYVSATGWPNDAAKAAKWWPAAVHIVGKDITRFHAVVWPAMLESAGLPLPKRVFGHGFVNRGLDRMSKTLGTIVDPKELAQKYGADAVRWFLLVEATYGRDLDYTEERLIARANGDLANTLGNLASRSVAMLVSYCGGVVPQPTEPSLMEESVAKAVETYSQAMDDLDLKGGFEAALSIAVRANLLVEEEAPWKLNKSPEKRARLERVLYDLIESCRVAAILLVPAMPVKMATLLKALGTKTLPAELRIGDARFGGLAAGTKLAKFEALFPRIEDPPAI